MVASCPESKVNTVLTAVTTYCSVKEGYHHKNIHFKNICAINPFQARSPIAPQEKFLLIVLGTHQRKNDFINSAEG